MKSFILSLALLLISEAGLAAGGAHHGDGIPAVVGWQTINFLIYAALLYFLLRKPTASFFKSRVENFQQALIRAEKAKSEAEAQRHEIEQRLKALENSAEQSYAQAQAEAKDLRNKIVFEAKGLSEKLKLDAQRTAEIELQRAKSELREEMLTQAVDAAKKILSERIAEPDQKRLQTEFVQKIQEVRS